MNSRYVFIALIILATVGVTARFSHLHEDIPIGCDEFGYLNLASAMEEGITYSHHRDVPWLTGLLDTLRNSGITEPEITWMIAPHAYHLLTGTNQVINQYPPGTSFVLRWLPLHLRGVLFPLATMLLIIGAIRFAAAKLWGKEINGFHIFFTAFLFLTTVSAPYLTEWTRINSLAPTFGLLMAAGMLLRSYPILSVLLIALSVNFRLANLLMILPVWFFMQVPLSKLFTSGRTWLFGLIAFAGILPLLIYNYLLTGNPFAVTYAQPDTAFVGWDDVKNSMTYYFTTGQLWFVVHIVVAGFVILLSLIRRIDFATMMAVLSFPLLNYLFFIFHQVRVDYYPYASAMIITGFLFAEAGKIKLKGKKQKWGGWLVVALALFLAVSGVMRYFRKDHVDYKTAAEIYSSLCVYDIVWCDLLSGTTEYVCGNNGFRFGTTTPRARKIALQYLKNQGYRQAILLDDNLVHRNSVIKELGEFNFIYTLHNNEHVGEIIEIQ
jgi:hypothetical protein